MIELSATRPCRSPPSLTHDTLKEIGVPAVGHRLKLLDAIAALRTDGLSVAIAPAQPSAAAMTHMQAVLLARHQRLITRFLGPHGAAELADFMPAGRAVWATDTVSNSYGASLRFEAS